MAPRSDSRSTSSTSSREQAEHHNSRRRSAGERRDEGEVRRSVNSGRSSFTEREGHDRRRTYRGYGQHEEEKPRRSTDGSDRFRDSGHSQDGGDRYCMKNLKHEAESPPSDLETEVFMSGDEGWQKVSKAFPDGLPNAKPRFVQNQDGDQARRSLNSGRKSYDPGFDREDMACNRNLESDRGGDLRRSEQKGRHYYIENSQGEMCRKSYDQGFDPEDAVCNRDLEFNRGGDLRRSEQSGRHYYIENSQGEMCRKSYDQGFDDPGEVRRSSNTSGRRSYDQGQQEDGPSRRSRSDSKRESGAEQRMFSRPPLVEVSDVETELYFEDSGWVKRSEVMAKMTKTHPKWMEVVLDPDNSKEMRSIFWDFSKPGVRVKGLGKACPEAARKLRTGDELLSINGVEVRGKSRSFIEEHWHEVQVHDDEVKLIFMPKS
eukprot:TRINITY_DN3166_c0_g1_i1.p1 TRINITY_DN3166_c0_g1~~TRINITY_DN3166_c0_g1_i1.p1  ORF type:complete len:430 (-),score=62.91 TRINITY_DN3166_c0_g1_i1:46-1335(-)